MNGSTIRRICGLTALWTFGWMAPNCHAEVFYAGQTKGFAGDEVELSINARAGTVLEAIDIVPELDAVASVLHFVAFVDTPGLSGGGSGLCTGQACGFFYLPEKTFATDTLLATLRFSIDPGASAGPVPFDAGVTVGSDPLPIPAGANFEVLAVPEPGNWALLLLGLLGMTWTLRRKADAR
jgi:PEP-CTERM motif